MEYTRSNGKRRVVITGAGMLSALGRTWAEVLAKLQAGKNCVKYLPELERFEQLNSRLGCPFEDTLPSFPRKKIRGMGRVALLSLMTTHDALDMAGLLKGGEDDVLDELKNGRAGVAYGCCMGSIDAIGDWVSMYQTGQTTKIDSQTYIKCMPHTNAANLSVYYQLRGRMIVTDVACASGSQAIGYAYEAISEGKQDVMVAGGADEFSPANIVIFDKLFAASVLNKSPELTPKPFDKDRDGLVIGEGAGTMVLEDLEHALRRGAKIYGEVVGFGTNADGDHITTPNANFQAAALQMALDDAQISADKIAYVNAHGTATSAGDISESLAVYKVFNRAVPISSTKSYIGHTLAASGCLEAWFSVGMMNSGWFHPNLNLQNVDPACAPLDYIAGGGREIEAEYVMSNNFAFGGVNTSLIFKKFEQ